MEAINKQVAAALTADAIKARGWDVKVKGDQFWHIEKQIDDNTTHKVIIDVAAGVATATVAYTTDSQVVKGPDIVLNGLLMESGPDVVRRRIWSETPVNAIAPWLIR